MTNIIETKKQIDGLVNVFFSELLDLAGDDKNLIPLVWEYRWRIQGETERIVNKFGELKCQ